MNALIFDGIILVVLLLFALWGRHRGLILSVFSLLALVVSIVGAFWLSNMLTPPVADWVQPMVEKSVVSTVQNALPEDADDVLATLSPENIDNWSESIHTYLDEAGIELPEQIESFLAELGEEDLSKLVDASSVEELAVSAAGKVVRAVVRIVLFLLAFALIQILWHLLARALDLVSRLPVLNAMNRLGGFLLGALKGILLLFVIAWLFQWYSTSVNTVIPAETIEQTYLLKFFLTASPLEFLASL